MFKDRVDAGRQLAALLERLRGPDVVVLGLPRGGVPVAFEVARALGVPLDVIVVRKLGVPSQPELGFGAIGEDGVRILNDEVVRLARLTPVQIAQVEARERDELDRRARRFRGSRRRLRLDGRVAIIVDDGIATGSTARAACRVARAHGAARVVLAVPVASPAAIGELRVEADEVVCAQAPEWLHAVGQFYGDFTQVTDNEVVSLLQRAAADPHGRDDEVSIVAGGVRLAGHLVVPGDAIGIVVFAHGSGSSRRSPRNLYVAGVLNAARLGTLLFDLLTPGEELDRANVFDIGLLARRLTDVARWLRNQPETRELPIGFFGASTGAGAALVSAARSDVEIAAVVSRGGRPDLADDLLAEVRAPTLLIVGGEDDRVLELNRQALRVLRCQARLAVVPGARHLFEEPGTLREAADLASQWFARHLGAAHHRAA